MKMYTLDSMANPDDILIQKDKKKVRICNEGHGLEFLTMRNGYQWTGFPVDDELLRMMSQAINKYFEIKRFEQTGDEKDEAVCKMSWGALSGKDY